MADFVTKTLVDKIDFDALHVNALAAGEPERAKIPMTLEDTEKAVQSAIESVGLVSGDELKVIRIKNTLKLDVTEVSSAYQEEIAERADLEPLSDARSMRFDRDGNLPPFTHCSGRDPGNLRVRDQAFGRTMHTTRSLTFVPVGPVMTASSRVFSNADVL